jgi:hypothetical protein
LLGLGTHYFRNGKYDEALENYFGNLKTYEDLGDFRLIGSLFNNIANTY